MLILHYADRRTTFTRGRPYAKNDLCHIEQKNWAVVRRLVGYDRLELEACQRSSSSTTWHATTSNSCTRCASWSVRPATVPGSSATMMLPSPHFTGCSTAVCSPRKCLVNSTRVQPTSIPSGSSFSSKPSSARRAQRRSRQPALQPLPAGGGGDDHGSGDVRRRSARVPHPRLRSMSAQAHIEILTTCDIWWP